MIPPSKEIISEALKRHKLVVKLLGKLLMIIEEVNKEDKRLSIFSEKVARKFLTQAITLELMFSEDIYIATKEKKERFIDISSFATLLRSQMESYSVFYHLFVDRCGMDEKVLRIRLWQLDGLQSRQKYLLPNDPKFLLIANSELRQIGEIIDLVKSFDYFKKLEQKKQDFLLSNNCWRFTNASLQNSDKGKIRLPIEAMIKRTGINDTLFQDWYSFTSTHVHSTYLSVIQNDTLTVEEKIMYEYVTMTESAIITAFFINDFKKIYQIADSFFNSLDQNEKEVVDSLYNAGKS